MWGRHNRPLVLPLGPKQLPFAKNVHARFPLNRSACILRFCAFPFAASRSRAGLLDVHLLPLACGAFTAAAVAVRLLRSLYAQMPRYNLALFHPSRLFLILMAAMVLRVAPDRFTLVWAGNASGTAGYADGVATSAQMNNPWSVAVDAAGTVFVADSGNLKLRAIYSNQSAVTLAAAPITGVATNASSAAGPVYFTSGHQVRVYFRNATILTIAGKTSAGYENAVGTNAKFSAPFHLALDTSTGILYVADQGNAAIRIIWPNSSVTTLAGGNATGFADGVGTNALFSGWLYGVGVASSTGIVYAADRNNGRVRIVYPNASVATLASGFSLPWGVAGSLDSSGIVYLAEYSGQKVWMLYPNGTKTVIAKSFNNPAMVSVDANGVVYVAERYNHRVSAIFPFSCAPGTYGNVSTSYISPSEYPVRNYTCLPCDPGSFSSSENALGCATCADGTFTESFGSASCRQCPGGHFCPAGTSSWARLNCGFGNYCPVGSGGPTPCRYQAPPTGGWGALQVQGPAFLAETARCRNHCFWNFTSGNGMMSKC